MKNKTLRVLKQAREFIEKLEEYYTPHYITPNSDSGLNWDTRFSLDDLISEIENNN